MTRSLARSGRLLLDTNVLVLFVVGTVNRGRIQSFKRTSKYTTSDFDLLIRVLGNWNSLYSVPHILAEVSNLTDLGGVERTKARQVLKETISVLTEVPVSSAQAALDGTYSALGLVDASIVTAARE